MSPFAFAWRCRSGCCQARASLHVGWVWQRLEGAMVAGGRVAQVGQTAEAVGERGEEQAAEGGREADAAEGRSESGRHFSQG